MYGYSFLSISHKLCDISLRHWPLFRKVYIDVGWGKGSAVRKNYCTGPSKLAMIPLYNPLKIPLDLDFGRIKSITYTAMKIPLMLSFFWEYCDLSPNFHIHVSVSDLYSPRIGLHTSFQQNRQTNRGNI